MDEQNVGNGRERQTQTVEQDCTLFLLLGMPSGDTGELMAAIFTQIALLSLAFSVLHDTCRAAFFALHNILPCSLFENIIS
jgi:hypothetical protein